MYSQSSNVAGGLLTLYNLDLILVVMPAQTIFIIIKHHLTKIFPYIKANDQPSNPPHRQFLEWELNTISEIRRHLEHIAMP